MQLFLFFAVVIMVVFGLVTFQNPDVSVTMKFINWTFEQKPLALMLAIPFVIGILAGTFICVPPWLKKVSLARHQKKRIHELESEIAELVVPEEVEEIEVEMQEEGETVKKDVKQDL